jgi:hypothetical protein
LHGVNGIYFLELLPRPGEGHIKRTDASTAILQDKRPYWNGWRNFSRGPVQGDHHVGVLRNRP